MFAGLVWVTTAAWAGDVAVEAVAGARPVTVPTGLVLAPCLAQPPVAPLHVEPVGTATIELRLRRGRLALVTRTVADPALQPLTACFERELAAVDWPLRRGKLAVSVTVVPDVVAAP